MSTHALLQTRRFMAWMEYAVQDIHSDPTIFENARTPELKRRIVHHLIELFEEYCRRHPGSFCGIDAISEYGEQEIHLYYVEDVRVGTRVVDGTIFVDINPCPQREPVFCISAPRETELTH